MNQPVSRRTWILSLVSSASVVAAACSSSGSASEVDTPEGRVLQWEGDDLLVLISGVEKEYRQSDTIHANVVANNQSTGHAQILVRLKVLGLGDQPVVQPLPLSMQIDSQDATSADQDLLLDRSLQPGDYTFSAEIPPWKVNGRDTGQGGTIRSAFHLDADSGLAPSPTPE